MGASAATAYLFYHSVWGLLWGIILIPMISKKRNAKQRKVYLDLVTSQFRSGMQTVAGALAAGASIEKAFFWAEEDVKKQYGENSEFAKELRKMNLKMKMNEPMEQVLLEFALQTGSEEICNFAEICNYAKRSGGNLSVIIKSTMQRLHEKAEVLKEIQNASAARVLEQKMLVVMVPGILFYLTISSPGYMGALYHNLIGVFVMTGCFSSYLVAWVWSERILDIDM